MPYNAKDGRNTLTHTHTHTHTHRGYQMDFLKKACFQAGSSRQVREPLSQGSSRLCSQDPYPVPDLSSPPDSQKLRHIKITFLLPLRVLLDFRTTILHALLIWPQRTVMSYASHPPSLSPRSWRARIIKLPITLVSPAAPFPWRRHVLLSALVPNTQRTWVSHTVRDMFHTQRTDKMRCSAV
jgi:hypothetical protein